MNSQNQWEKAGTLILTGCGENLERPGLERTPARFSKAMKEILSGYHSSPHDAIGEGIFPSHNRGIVSVHDVSFYSMCEHHLLPFAGRVSLAYIPNGKIIGLSKIPRLIEVFSRRLQVQERLTNEILDSFNELISPRASGVSIQAEHFCMSMRGVQKQGSTTITTSYFGLSEITQDERDEIKKILTFK